MVYSDYNSLGDLLLNGSCYLIASRIPPSRLLILELLIRFAHAAGPIPRVDSPHKRQQSKSIVLWLLGSFGSPLGASWAIFGGSWALLGGSWGESWAVLGGSWGALGPSWGGSWAALGALGPSWDGLGAILGLTNHKVDNKVDF